MSIISLGSRDFSAPDAVALLSPGNDNGAKNMLFLRNLKPVNQNEGAMMRFIFSLLFVAILLPASANATNLRITLDAKPLAVFYSPGATEFIVTKGGKRHRADNGVFLLPGARAGVALTIGDARYGLAGGFGTVEDVPHLFSSSEGAFEGSWSLIETTANFYRGKWMIGPRLGLVRFSQLDWEEGGSIDLSPTTALMAGVAFSAGGSRVKFSMNLDYLVGAKFRAKGKNGWTPSEKHLDLSGIGFSLGVIILF